MMAIQYTKGEERTNYISHAGLVSEVSHEPNYEEALKAVR